MKARTEDVQDRSPVEGNSCFNVLSWRNQLGMIAVFSNHVTCPQLGPVCQVKLPVMCASYRGTFAPPI